MIVCSCNVLTDRDVRTAVTGSEPPRTAGQVYGCLGCSPQCGRCARTIRRIMDEAVAATPAARRPTAITALFLELFTDCQSAPGGSARAPLGTASRL